MSLFLFSFIAYFCCCLYRSFLSCRIKPWPVDFFYINFTRLHERFGDPLWAEALASKFEFKKNLLAKITTIEIPILNIINVMVMTRWGLILHKNSFSLGCWIWTTKKFSHYCLLWSLCGVQYCWSALWYRIKY